VGGVECLALSLAPLLAGIIAKYSTWRVCFYISIPFGVFSALVVLTMMDLPQTAQQSSPSIRQKLVQLDLPGIALFVPFVICLILSLQWGGTVYPWSDARVIVLLVFFGALAAAFAVEQYFANIKSTATVPVAILRSPTILLVVSYAFSTAAALNLYEYYVRHSFSSREVVC
jgi:predicted MFS family arabinose efflux permease